MRVGAVPYVVALDRKYQGWALSLQVPPHQADLFLGTMLDTELVLDKRTQQPFFLIFDVLQWAGQNLFQQATPWLDRQLLLRTRAWTELRWPATWGSMQIKTYAVLHREAGRQRLQLAQMAQQARYACDGVICCPLSLPLGVGRQAGLVRLKQAETLDVLYLGPPWQFALHHQGRCQPLACSGKQALTITNPAQLVLAIGAVYEGSVVLDHETNQLVCTLVMLREDKKEPNDLSTLQHLQACLRDQVTW